MALHDPGAHHLITQTDNETPSAEMINTTLDTSILNFSIGSSRDEQQLATASLHIDSQREDNSMMLCTANLGAAQPRDLSNIPESEVDAYGNYTKSYKSSKINSNKKKYQD